MDLDLLYFLQEARVPFVTLLMNGISYLAAEYITVLVICLFYWSLDKKLAYKISLSFLFGGVLVQGLKIVLKIPRPFVRDSRLFVDKTAESGATGYSFPSGHTQSATATYAPIGLHFKKKWLAIVMFALIVLIMFSRMYLGCHTIQDVLVSFAITFAVTLVINIVVDSGELTLKKNLIIAISALVLTIAVAVYGFVTVNDENIANVMDGFKTAGIATGFVIGWFIEASFIKYDNTKNRKVLNIILKTLVGLGVALLLQQGPKFAFTRILNTDVNTTVMIPVHIVRYLLCGLWLTAAYPAILKKLGK